MGFMFNWLRTWFAIVRPTNPNTAKPNFVNGAPDCHHSWHTEHPYWNDKKFACILWVPFQSQLRELYERLKATEKPSAEKAFIGFGMSYNGAWFGGFRGDYDAKGTGYCAMNKRTLTSVAKALAPQLKMVSSRSFTKFHPKGQFIYCDPPYLKNNSRSPYFSKFDHEKFWQVMREWSKRNIVVVSERVAPPDFQCVWKADYKVSYRKETSYEEALFMYKPLAQKLFASKRWTGAKMPLRVHDLGLSTTQFRDKSSRSKLRHWTKSKSKSKSKSKHRSKSQKQSLQRMKSKSNKSRYRL